MALRTTIAQLEARLAMDLVQNKNDQINELVKQTHEQNPGSFAELCAKLKANPQFVALCEGSVKSTARSALLSLFGENARRLFQYPMDPSTNSKWP